MPRIKIGVHVEPDDTFPSQIPVQINEKVVKKLKLPLHEPVLLRFGAWREAVVATDVPNSRKVPPTIKVTETLANDLGLSTGNQLHAAYLPSRRELRLGPVLGIFTDTHYNEEGNGRFGPNTSFFKEVSQAAHELGTFVYIFTQNGIDLQKERITGWRINQGKWSKIQCPFPDVIHNRLTSRGVEDSESIQNAIKKFQEHHIPVFNHCFLNKVEVTRLLAGEGSVSSHMPNTVLKPDPKVIHSFIRKYPVIFVKPSMGSLGQGIMRISQGSNEWKMIQSTVNGSEDRYFKKSSELVKFLLPRLKKNLYLIQRGIPLIHIFGSSIDFRALLQKDHTGSWSITSIVARVASTKSFVSNVAQGGKLLSVSDALKQSNLPSTLIPRVNKQLRQTSMNIAEVINRKADGHFAELGIDLGVDPTGRVWIIEVNSKPSKTEDSTLSSQKIRPSVKRMLRYVHYLTEQSDKETGE